MELIKAKKMKKQNIQVSCTGRKKTTLPKGVFETTIQKLNKQVLRIVKAV